MKSVTNLQRIKNKLLYHSFLGIKVSIVAGGMLFSEKNSHLHMSFLYSVFTSSKKHSQPPFKVSTTLTPSASQMINKKKEKKQKQKEKGKEEKAAYTEPPANTAVSHSIETNGRHNCECE